MCRAFLCVTTRFNRDGFDSDKRSAAPSKVVLQRKSPQTAPYNMDPKTCDPSHEQPPIQDATSSVSATATTDRPLQAATATSAAQRPSRSTVSSAPSSSSSERFASRQRDGSDPDYDRHYGKYAPRNAMMPAAMAWPVLPAGGGYGMPVAGIPMGAPYEAMSPM